MHRGSWYRCIGKIKMRDYINILMSGAAARTGNFMKKERWKV